MSALAVPLLTALISVAQAAAGSEIRGTVVDPDGKPVAGAEVALSAGAADDGSVPILERTTTDPSGAFSLARPDAARRRGFQAKGIIWAYKPRLGLGIVDLARSDRPGQTPQLVLETPASRRLTIRDADGQPVAGAKVAPKVFQTARTATLRAAVPDGWLGRFAALSDAGGVAGLPGVSRQIVLRSVMIEVPGRGTHVATLPYDQGKDDVTLSLGRPARLDGQVKHPSGEPAARVPVAIWVRCGVPRDENSSFYLVPERVPTQAGPTRTAADGSFETPPILLAGSTYRVVIRADGFAPAVSAWIKLTGTNHFPTITLHPLRTLTGRLVDRQGKPISGATVVQPAGGPATTSDDLGRFRLEGGRPGRSFLLARCDGFRLEGRLIEATATDPIELALSRPSEPPERMMATLPDPIPAGERLTLARRVLDPYLKQVLAQGDDAARFGVLDALRWIDPAELLEQVQKTRFTREIWGDTLRARAALGLAASDPDEAAAVAETISNPATRAGAFLDLAAALPAAERTRKFALIDRAALCARAAPHLNERLHAIGQVAERWYELAEIDKARALFAEGLQLANQLVDKTDPLRGVFFAGRLARVEPNAALALAGDVRQGGLRQRAYANIAIRLAYDHPAEAERVLGQLEDPSWRILAAARICRRLAAMDAARARRIAAALPSAMERAYAWTFLADGFLTVDRAAARAAVDQALRELDAQDPVDWTQMLEPNPAASILPLVERIAPERLAEVFWRAVALQASSDDPRADFGHDHPLTAEALLLARYDRAVAAALFEPVGAFVRSRPLRGKNDLSPAILLGLACLDPNEAVKVVESLLPARTLSINEPANYARVNLAEYLAMPPERRWMRIWRFHAGCGIAMFEEIYRDLSFE